MSRLYKIIKENPVYLIYLPLGIHWCLIFTLSSLPGEDYIPTIDLGDKVDHFAAYFVLSVFLYLAMIMQKKYPRFKEFPVKYTFIIAFFYGVFDEFHQLFIPGRYFDLFDLLADVVGTILALYIVHLLHNKVIIVNRKQAQEQM